MYFLAVSLLIIATPGVRASSKPCFESRYLMGWLRSHQKSDVSFFCRDDISMEDVSEDAQSFYAQGVKSCTRRGHFIGVNFDSTGRPYGRGALNMDHLKGDHMFDEDKFCINVHEDVTSIHGGFVDGYPEGNVRIRLKNNHRIEGRSVKGILHGKTRIYDQNQQLLFLGTFASGRPNGWSWIYSYDIEKSGVIFAYFDGSGKLDSSKIIYLEPNLLKGHLGEIANDSLLSIDHDVIVEDSSEENCVYQIQFSESNRTRNSLILPVIVQNEDSLTSLYLRANHIYMYNRIAKTGSQSIIELLTSLMPKTGVKVKVDQRHTESLMEPFNIVKTFTEEVNEQTSPSVFVRHYNFVDFKLYGSSWNPIYINMVRSPVERVISWYYYLRASWNIIERLEAFPNEPLPDSKFLRKDFSSCVLDPNDDECNFIEGTSNIDFPDHRSQMSVFCGHEIYCADFNSQKVLQKAKENVDKFYPVVGVIEALNQSLAVFEDRFPTLFSGAQEVYHSSSNIEQKKIVNNLKPSIPNEIIDILNRNFTREIEFYDFCKQRLQNQYETLSLSLKT